MNLYLQFPILRPCNVEPTLKPTWRLPPRFSPLLKGYFHSPFPKAFTSRLLSAHPKTVYSSLSLHLAVIDVETYYNGFGG